MTQPDQRCGTCKWWRRLILTDIGDCTAPIPSSIMVEGTDVMTGHEGTSCPCWEAKE